MTHKIEDFGRNAGKIWETLNSNGPLNQNILIRKNKLNENEFYTAIGWLARENKVCKDGNMFKLGETNLNDKIGENAGKIWELLNTIGEIDAEYIHKLANISKQDAYLAIGWLAKENKIKPKMVKPKKPKLHFKLK